MSPELRKSIAAALGTGAIGIATVMVSGKTGLEGREYYPYKDVVGVNDLEMMMAEWFEGSDDTPGIDAGYIFSADDVAPDPGDAHGLTTGKLSAVFHNLAVRIAPDYAVEPTAKIITTAKYGKERLIKLSAMSRASNAKCKSGYPNRMPVGSGNRLATYNGWNFYRRKGPCDNGSE